MRYGDVKYGDYVLRAIPARSGKGFEGFVLENRNFGVFADETREGLIRKLQECVRQNAPGFIGYKQARDQFLQRFPDGFKDPGVLGARETELTSKRKASRLIKERVPLEAALEGRADAKAMTAIMAIPGVFVRQEMGPLHAMLESDNGPELIRVIARFAVGEIEITTAAELMTKLKASPLSSWTKLTLPATLWRPKEHALLQPTVSQAFATAVGHDYPYEYTAKPNTATYKSYLSLLDELGREIVDLEPEDYIDLQTFAHVAMKYPLAAAPQTTINSTP